MSYSLSEYKKMVFEDVGNGFGIGCAGGGILYFF